MQTGTAGSDEGTAIVPRREKRVGRETCFIAVRSGNGTESLVHSFRPIGLRIQVEITCSARAKDPDVREHDLCDLVTWIPHRYAKIDLAHCAILFDHLTDDWMKNTPRL